MSEKTSDKGEVEMKEVKDGTDVKVADNDDASNSVEKQPPSNENLGGEEVQVDYEESNNMDGSSIKPAKKANSKKMKKQSSKKQHNKKATSKKSVYQYRINDSDDEDDPATHYSSPAELKPARGSEYVQISWHNLKYTVPKKEEFSLKKLGKCCDEKEQVTILGGVSGWVNPGSMIAILGPSGAGKTSFLNLLSMRIKPARGINVEGEIKINGQPLTHTKLLKISGFVAQDDVLMGSQTAWEALTMTAKLTLGGELDDDEIERHVETLLKEMGLWHVRGNFIGYTGSAGSKSGIKRGLSGGERKRVSVCVELIHDPKILFLDEPTSGLDSFAARAVVDCLRAQANQGRTIVCTIHQPSAEVFRKFDKVLILAAGQTVFIGPSSEATSYFKSIGYSLPPFTNPADYMIKIVQVPQESEPATKPIEGDDIEAPDDEEKRQGLRNVAKEQVKSLIQAFDNSEHAKKAKSPPDLSDKGCSDIPTQSDHKRASIAKAYGLLINRSFKNVWREPMLFKTRMFQTIFMGLMAGLIFLRLETDFTGSGDRISGGFFIVMNQMFGSINGPTLLFPAERAVFFREKGSGLYTTLPYFIAKLGSEFPVNVLAPLVAGCIAWWMIGFNDNPNSFGVFLIVIIILSNIGYSLGILLNVIFLDPAMVNRIQPLILLPFMLFAGFFINLSSIPDWLQWLQYCSFVKYAFRAVINVIMDGLTFTCAAKDLRPLFIVTNYIPGIDPNVTSVGIVNPDTLVCYPISGSDVLDQLGVAGYDIWVDILILIGFLIGFLFLGFIVLHFRKPKL